jgi:hypothetical protein
MKKLSTELSTLNIVWWSPKFYKEALIVIVAIKAHWHTRVGSDYVLAKFCALAPMIHNLTLIPNSQASDNVPTVFVLSLQFKETALTRLQNF